MNSHEQGFLEFLAEPTRRRMATLLALGEKRRTDVRALFDHGCRLDPRFSRHLQGKAAFAEPIARLLIGQGAPRECHVLASDAALDGLEMPLDEALKRIVGMGSGAYISCVPGRLGFFEFADRNSSYFITR